MQMKSVLIAGNFSFPKGNAAGKRVLGLGYIFKDLGYKVYYIGCKANRTKKDIIETLNRYEDFTSYFFYGARDIKTICDVNGAFKEFKKVVEEIGLENLSLIVLYGSPVLAHWIYKVYRLGNKYKVPVVFDCVDWIETSGFDSFIKNAIKYVDTNYMKRILAVRCNGVIAVSEYIYNFYKSKGVKTIVIPPVGVWDESKEYDFCNENLRESISFIYAGSVVLKKNINRMKLKDRIDISIEIFYNLHRRGLNFVFDIFGIEKQQYLMAIPEHQRVLNELGKKVCFHGRVSNDLVLHRIKQSDFTVLNRTITKVTTAGFPSKIAESILLGVPVITNPTSDIAKYVKNGENGLIISFDTEKAANEIFDFVNKRENILQVKRNCNNVCCFDYRLFTNKVRDFLDKL